MANLLTAVPASPPPPLRGLGRRLLPAADLFMVALASRPRSRTLATTWVTPATMLLAAASLIGALSLAAAAAAGRTQWAPALVALAACACAVVFVGAGSILAVGVAQHRTRGSS
ncbi:MAG TPA: hypothetical protein VF155_02355 [Candidatus Dormibacteraeota bacterium]